MVCRGDITGSDGNDFYTAADPSKAFQDGNTREIFRF